MKTAFLNWISEKTGMDAAAVSDAYAGLFEQLFSEIETEYGNVSAGDLDPRYVLHFNLA